MSDSEILSRLQAKVALANVETLEKWKALRADVHAIAASAANPDRILRLLAEPLFRKRPASADEEDGS